jgi:hypothetical protein
MKFFKFFNLFLFFFIFFNFLTCFLHFVAYPAAVGRGEGERREAIIQRSSWNRGTGSIGR